LGVGPTGYEARDHARRSRAVATGYLGKLGCFWTPGPPEMRWWLALAAIQLLTADGNDTPCHRPVTQRLA
jgi:hypothetical protein